MEAINIPSIKKIEIKPVIERFVVKEKSLEELVREGKIVITSNPSNSVGLGKE